MFRNDDTDDPTVPGAESTIPLDSNAVYLAYPGTKKVK